MKSITITLIIIIFILTGFIMLRLNVLPSLFITITPMQFSITQTGEAGFSKAELGKMIDGFLNREISKGYVPEKEKPEKVPEKET